MDSGVTILCFAASYAIALAIEVVGGWRQIAWRRWGLLAAAAAGIVAHTWYLGQRIAATPAAPLASPHDWFLVAAWLLAAISFAAVVYYPGRSLGLFLLPATLALIGMSLIADDQPLASFAATRFWGILHSVMLLLGFLAVLLGFLAGLMYLLQSWRLKRKTLVTANGFRLPSLEWLELANSRSLAAGAVSVGLGFATGVLLQWSRRDATGGIAWSDPVAISLAAVFLWLLVAEGFRLLYPAARGRKVAYLTITAFVFLLMAAAAFALDDSLHRGPARGGANSEAAGVDAAKSNGAGLAPEGGR